MEQELQPYLIIWLNIQELYVVEHQYLVEYSIVWVYEDSVMCDMVHVLSRHILLGRP